MNVVPVENLPTTPLPVLELEPALPRTQKARGIAALARYHAGYLVPPFEVHSASSVRPEQLIGYFSRPCPMRPRHGFVDSRSIASVEEGDALIRQTLDADPEAEIVTMPLIEAACSGIWTTGLLTIGESNDGATAGTSAWTLPAVGNLVTADTMTKAGVQDTPYVEILWPKSGEEYRLVQLRDGPALPRSIDYIPFPLKVEDVVVAEGDLLEWETKMQQARPGTVVYHPGGSLASHYAIHGVLNHIPVLISREPKVGDTLETAGQVCQAACDVDLLRAGFHFATRLRLSYGMAAELMLAGCHHISVWVGRHDALLGLALGLAYRLTVTAALGEMRHAPGGDDDVSRDAIYSECWNATHLPSTRTGFESALSAFHEWVWRRSYGGAKWFEFTRWAAVLNNHLVNGCARPALKAFNQLVHCAHNTGWAFDKFMSSNTFTDTANNPISGLVRCAPVLYQAHRILDARSAALAKRFRDSRVLLSIPQGPPNLDTIDDEEGSRYVERREGSSDEPAE